MKMVYADEMVEPVQCQHARVMHVNAKADDRQQYRVPHLDIDRDEYAPRINGLCRGDYIELTVCLDCGFVTSLSQLPVTDDDLYEAFDIEPPFWDGDDNEHPQDDYLDKLGR